MEIRLSDHFSYKRILRFTAPSVIMMIFTSLYGVVDGFFVSNFVGKTPFATVNFIMPFLMIPGPIGFLFGAGGSAVIARLFGQGQDEKARGIFSMLVYVTIALSLCIAASGFLFLRPIAALLGAEGQLLEDSVTYGRILLVALPFQMVQFEFQTFFITAEKPKLGLFSTLFAGCANIVLDALFIAVFGWGLVGAALATALSQAIGGIIPLFYFGRKNDSLLRLTRPEWDLKALWATCTNGSSELVSNISMSLVGMVYNAQLIRLAGENGVAAYGVLMYVNFIFISAFIGYATGIAPVFSYHLGADGKEELKSLLKKSLIIVFSLCAFMFLSAELLAPGLSALFVSYDPELFDLTVSAFRLFSLSYLFCGFCIFGSAFFTALGDGATSALISFLRTLVFQIACVFLLPLAFGLNGIWLAEAAANLPVFFLTAYCIRKNRKKYGY